MPEIPIHENFTESPTVGHVSIMSNFTRQSVIHDASLQDSLDLLKSTNISSYKTGWRSKKITLNMLYG